MNTNEHLCKYIYELYYPDPAAVPYDLDLWIKIAIPYRTPDGQLRKKPISDRQFFTLRKTHELKYKLLHQLQLRELFQELYTVTLHPSRLEWIF